MALSAYMKPQICPACGEPVEQSEKEGRSRLFHNDACKMRYHRLMQSRCLWCERPRTLPSKPYAGQVVHCWNCSAEMRWERDPHDKKHHWKTIKNGKKNLRAAAKVTE